MLVLFWHEEAVGLQLLLVEAFNLEREHLREFELNLQIDSIDLLLVLLARLLDLDARQFENLEVFKRTLNDHIVDLPVALERVDSRLTVLRIKVQNNRWLPGRQILRLFIPVGVEQPGFVTVLFFFDLFKVHHKLKLHESFLLLADAADFDEAVFDRWILKLQKVLGYEKELSATETEIELCFFVFNETDILQVLVDNFGEAAEYRRRNE